MIDAGTTRRPAPPLEIDRLRRRVADLEARLAARERTARPEAAVFQALMEAIPAPVFFKDPSGVYLGCNRAFTEILGIAEDEVLGRRVSDLPGVPLGRHEGIDAAVLRDGRARTYETQLLDASGRNRHVVVHKAAFARDDGAIGGIVGVLLDVTERRQAEEALRASEELRRSITDNAPAYVLLLDRDGVIQFINRTQGDFQRSDILGSSIYRFLPAAIAEELGDVIQRVLTTGRPAQHELPYRRQDGGLQIFDARIGPVRGEDGEVVALAVNAADVTDRKLAEDGVRASEERYRLLAENVSDLICTLDADLRLTYVSPAAKRIFGVPARYLEGRRIEDVAPAATRELLRAGLADHDGRDGPITLDLDLPHRDGRVVHTEARVSVVLNEAGEPDTLFALVRDISDWRRAQEQLRQSEERLRQQQKLEAIGKLAGGVAHDFNNMLTVILGNAQILLHRLADEAAGRREAEEIQGAAERAAALTRQLLAFSRKQVLVPKVLDLDRVVRGTESILRRLIGEDVELATDLAATGHVEADPGQLEQVLVNLAVNARDAMPGGGRLEITTRDVAAGETELAVPAVRLEVRDSGVGIAPEDAGRIFEPFFTTKEKGKGTGLGLSMVYGIVQQSNGTVRVESRPLAGSLFVIDLPRVERPASTDGAALAPATAGREGSETILVVEDEDGVRALVARTLESRGYRVLAAASGEEALARAAGESIDLVISDVVMPGMSGFELVERLAATLPAHRVLLMSGHTEDALSRHRRNGSRDLRLLEKPFAPSAIAETVRVMLDAPAPAAG